MLNKIFLLLFFTTFFYSCNNKKISNKETIILQEKKSDTIQKYVLKFDEKLTPKGKTLVEEWGEYQRFNKFLEDNQVYIPEESLLNAKELAKLAQELKDSIRIEKLQTPAVKIRLNVINNEALRLEDMSEISVITDEEVRKEYNKIYEAFSALNSKINNNLNQEKLNEELKDFIDEVSTNDTSYPNTVIETKPKENKIKELNIPK